MKITYELDLERFEAWSGAVDTLNRIREEGLCCEFELALEELYPEGMTETQLNDLLWFDEDWCYELVGLRTESGIREELEEAQDAMSELRDAFLDECAEYIEEVNSNRETAGMNELDEEEENSLRAEIWANSYKAEADELKERIAELEEELENL